MAIAFGVELKKLTHTRGHEGEDCTNADIYLDGKRIGYYHEILTAGGLDIHVSDEDFARLKERAIKFRKLHPYPKELSNLDDDDVELFIYDIVKMVDYEKRYKRWIKKGYALVAFKIERCQVNTLAVPKNLLSDPKYSNEALAKEGYTDIFTSLKDFIVDEQTSAATK